jgi:hypothetical protein
MRKALAKKSNKGLMDTFKLRGHLEYILRNAQTGEIVQRGKGHNTVTASGRGWALAKLNYSTNQTYLQAVAFGSNSATAPTSNDSSLVSYTAIKTIGTTGLTSASNTTCVFTGAVSFASTETWTGSNQIGEFGLYNSNTSAGTLFNRLTTGTYINFATSNTLAVTITISN